MKHAGSATLKALGPLLDELRALPGLSERTPGSFYRKSRAYLHFHEDRAGWFADVKLQPGPFTRLPVSTPLQRRQLLARVVADLGAA
jgi:hypothetical protein